MQGIAQAQPNIALVKYWGKQPGRDNVPATPSLSITLDSLWTRTQVGFSKAYGQDHLTINGELDHAQQQRVSRWLTDFRRTTGASLYANVESKNNFPTGAGLASSASGFAALVTAACSALNLNLSTDERCRLARRGSASAARSILGGFVEMDITDPDPAASSVLNESGWPLQVLVVVTSTAQKQMGSTEGMARSAATSDFYSSWTGSARVDFSTARQAIMERDFQMLADVSEVSCLKMHGVMLSTKPALVYWNGTTVETIHCVRELRSQGMPVFFTIDAGPQVKVVTLPGRSDELKQAIATIPGVIEIIPSTLGAGARVIEKY
jgi:diphosphomevalonate decarboxylase